MSVTNEDLRNDITKIGGVLRELTNIVAELKDGNNDRRKDSERINLLYTGLSIIRWLIGLMFAGVVGIVWRGYADLRDATFANIEQARQIQELKEKDIIHDTRLQALERGQFASTLKEPGR